MSEQIQNTMLAWLEVMKLPEVWWQLAVLALAFAMAVAIRNLIRANVADVKEGEVPSLLRKMSRKGFNRIQFPITMLMVTLIGQPILNHQGIHTPLLAIATPLLLSLAGIRVAVYLLRKGFAPSPLVKASESLIATTVWIMVAMHLLGWLPDVLIAIDGIAITMGESRISLLLVLKLIMTVGFFWVLALWLGNMIEQRLQQSQHISISSRVALSKFSKFILLAIAFAIAVNASGIDLTALTVFGGAVGVGIGFGLQRIISNFISGFILLFDRSIKPGDVITVRDKFGWVQELRARYIVVRDRDGVETLIPNENLVTSEVINWSYSDPNVRIKIPVQISYANDPEEAMQIMLDCAKASVRVLTTPEPLCRLMNFADSGIELELRLWIGDPENGLGGVRSEVNVAIWRAFKEAGITIPYPQRDIHIKSGGHMLAADGA